MAKNELSPWVFISAILLVLCVAAFFAGCYWGGLTPKTTERPYIYVETEESANASETVNGTAAVEQITPTKHADGTLVKQEGVQWVYLIEDGRKRMLRINVDAYKSRHAGAKDVVIISAEEMKLYPVGPDVTKDSESHRHHDRDRDDEEDEEEEEEEEERKEEPNVYDVELVASDKIAHDVRGAQEGVLADEQYMRGKLHYPFTLNRPEADLLQVTFSDVRDNNDGSYTIRGNIPSFDETEIEAVYIAMAVVDENGKFSKTVTMEYADSPGVIETRVSEGDMEGDPEMIAFSISYLAAGDRGRKYTAQAVGDGSLAPDFMDASAGVIAGTNAMQGRMVYPFAVERPEENLLGVTFRGVVDGNGEVIIVGTVPEFDESKIKAVHISAAAIDWTGKYSEEGSVTVKNSGDDFKIRVGKGKMTELPKEIIFEAVYEPIE